MQTAFRNATLNQGHISNRFCCFKEQQMSVKGDENSECPSTSRKGELVSHVCDLELNSI